MDEQALRVALVTNGSGGLGRPIAVELARRGWSIFIHHFGTAEQADEAADEMRSAAKQAKCDIQVATGRADLTASAAREQLIDEVMEEFGRIDMLVNAATARPAVAEDLLEITADAYQDVLNAGVTATLFLTQLVANEMVRLAEAGEIENPKIVTINSISAYTTSVDHAPHCISRAALSMMTQLFADRLGEHGINVYEVRVGLISTGPGDPAHGRYDELIDQGLTPVRRWGRASDVARAVAAIAEDLLSFSTGETINVDGGFHLRRL